MRPTEGVPGSSQVLGRAGGLWGRKAPSSHLHKGLVCTCLAWLWPAPHSRTVPPPPDVSGPLDLRTLRTPPAFLLKVLVPCGILPPLLWVPPPGPDLWHSSALSFLSPCHLCPGPHCHCSPVYPHIPVGHLLGPGLGLSAGEADGTRSSSTSQWSHTVNRAMVGAPWELQEPRGGSVTPIGGIVRESFPEEVALNEATCLYLQPL